MLVRWVHFWAAGDVSLILSFVGLARLQAVDIDRAPTTCHYHVLGGQSFILSPLTGVTETRQPTHYEHDASTFRSKGLMAAQCRSDLVGSTWVVKWYECPPDADTFNNGDPFTSTFNIVYEDSSCRQLGKNLCIDLLGCSQARCCGYALRWFFQAAIFA